MKNLNRIKKIRVRKMTGKRKTWSLVLDGSPDKNCYPSFNLALRSAVSRLQRRAVENFLDEVEVTDPSEYTGIPVHHIIGPSLEEKRVTLANRAKARGWAVDIEIDDDMEGKYTFYMRLLNRGTR